MNQESILLKDLQALSKECEWVEFKINNVNPTEIGEYLSALSNGAALNNQDYGYLVYGIEDTSHQLVGTKFKPSKTKVGNQELENWLATQLDPKIYFKIHEFNFDEMSFVIIQIDSATNTPISFQGNSFIRIGSYKKKLKDHPEHQRKIWVRSTSPFEREVCLHSLTIDSVLEIIDYPKFFELFSLPLPTDKQGIIRKLIEESVIINSGIYYEITNLGGLIFSKRLSEIDSLGRKAIRVIKYKGNDRSNTIKEQIGQKGYAVGFEGLIDFVLDQLPTNEEIEKAFRKEVSLYPKLAIRELVANCIIHQDLSVKGVSPMVEIFQNRIEITNPGKPLIDTQRFIDHSPESRNEILASTMRRLNICEERGSGIDKVIIQCEMYQLPAPDFIVGDNYTRIILYAPKQLTTMDKNDKIRACYQHACIRYLSGELMTNESLRDRFAITQKNYPMASRIISESIASNQIKYYDPESNSKKYAKYIPYWA